MIKSLACLALTALLAPSAAADPSRLRPEAPSVAQARNLYLGSIQTGPLSTTADLLRLHQECDADLAVMAIMGHWVFDTLSQGRMPDDRAYQRILKGFSWDEASVLQLSKAGISKALLRALARANPLGIAAEAQGRLAQAGVDPTVIQNLALPPQHEPLPPLRRVGDFIRESTANNPMFQNPAIKAQVDGAMKQAEKQIVAKAKSKEFQNEIWEKLLDAWRAQVFVGPDSATIITPVATDLVGHGGPQTAFGAEGIFSDAQAANDLFLHSTPLGAVLDVTQVISILGAKRQAEVRAKDPASVEVFPVDQGSRFITRKNPDGLTLIRLQEGPEGPMARFTKGLLFGRQLKPADEPISFSVTQEGDHWIMRPKAPLPAGSYAFIAGGKDLLFLPFTLKAN